MFLITAKFTNHKGRNRRFTNPEELEKERVKEEKEKTWRVRFKIYNIELFILLHPMVDCMF